MNYLKKSSQQLFEVDTNSIIPIFNVKNRGIEKDEVICPRWQGKKVAEFMFPSGEPLAKKKRCGF